MYPPLPPAASSVGHTLGLLDAQEPFLLKSGISRLLIVTRMSGSGRRRAVEGGAMPKLLRLVDHENEGKLGLTAFVMHL